MTDRDYLSRLALRSIHLHSARHERGDGDPNVEMTISSRGALRPTTSPERELLAYKVSIEYLFRGDGAGEESGSEVASGAVTFLATYEVTGDALVEDQIEDFAYNGVLFQVHPYLREHIASMCLRSGLPAYQLPLLTRNDVEDNDDFVSPATHTSAKTER